MMCLVLCKEHLHVSVLEETCPVRCIIMAVFGPYTFYVLPDLVVALYDTRPIPIVLIQNNKSAQQKTILPSERDGLI